MPRKSRAAAPPKKSPEVATIAPTIQSQTEMLADMLSRPAPELAPFGKPRLGVEVEATQVGLLPTDGVTDPMSVPEGTGGSGGGAIRINTEPLTNRVGDDGGWTEAKPHVDMPGPDGVPFTIGYGGPTVHIDSRPREDVPGTDEYAAKHPVVDEPCAYCEGGDPGDVEGGEECEHCGFVAPIPDEDDRKSILGDNAVITNGPYYERIDWTHHPEGDGTMPAAPGFEPVPVVDWASDPLPRAILTGDHTSIYASVGGRTASVEVQSGVNDISGLVQSLTHLIHLGNALRIAREQSGVTMGDVARALDVSVTVVSDWERGRVLPSRLEFTGFCDAIHAGPDEVESLWPEWEKASNQPNDALRKAMERRQHVWHDCKVDGHVPKGAGDRCLVCDGGLGGCTVCGQWEAQIELTCPGGVPKWAMRKDAVDADEDDDLGNLPNGGDGPMLPLAAPHPIHVYKTYRADRIEEWQEIGRLADDERAGRTVNGIKQVVGQSGSEWWLQNGVGSKLIYGFPDQQAALRAADGALPSAALPTQTPLFTTPPDYAIAFLPDGTVTDSGPVQIDATIKMWSELTLTEQAEVREKLTATKMATLTGGVRAWVPATLPAAPDGVTSRKLYRSAAPLTDEEMAILRAEVRDTHMTATELIHNRDDEIRSALREAGVAENAGGVRALVACAEESAVARVLADPELAYEVYRAVESGRVKIAQWLGATLVSVTTSHHVLGRIFPTSSRQFGARFGNLDRTGDASEVECRGWVESQAKSAGWAVVPSVKREKK